MLPESALDVLGVHLCQHLHLHLQDLQALKHTSKQLQAWITSLPEPAWHAVAAKTLPPYHPALCSGGVGTYLAWQTARDRQFAAALAAGGFSWPGATLTFPDLRSFGAAQGLVSVLSHDHRTLAVAMPGDGGQLVLTQLQTRSQHSVLPPPGYQPPQQGQMVFSPDDGCLAVLMPEREGLETGRLRRGCCILLLSNPPAPDCPSMCEAADHDRFMGFPLPDKLEWAANSRMFCLTIGDEGDYPQPDFWVFDENLALRSHFQTGILGTAHQVIWNASATGVLVQCLAPAGHIKDWHLCRFPVQIPCANGLVQGCWFEHMHWGSWLPGTGEVILTSSKHTWLDPPLTCLVCCVIDEQPDFNLTEFGMVELGLLLNSPDMALWTASMRHVAVVIKAVDSTMLQLSVLEPGPQLRLLHSLEMGAVILQITFSPDGRYLLLHEQVLGHAGLEQGCGRPVIVQVSSGIKVTVSDKLSHYAQSTWTPAGIGLVTGEAHQKVLVDFPITPRRALA